MANQTVSVNRNIDDAAISGLLNGEDITINTNAVLTINSDSRWGQQAAVVGNITIDAGTGGTCRFDGRDVWWLPYDNGTGNVPALGTAGVQDSTAAGGATGEFLGVFTALGVAPSAAASAMPVTGFIKFRSKVGTFVDNEVVTLPGGATVDVNSATGGQRGWLHIVGEETTLITVPRVGKFESFGDWFELGTGSGATGQTLQYYVGDICPAVQVETSAGSGVYEWWVNAGATRWGQNNRIGQDARGKYFNCTAAGVITFALRGAVNNGAVPPTGAKIRVPNIHVSNSLTPFTANLISTTIATRWEFATTSAGDVEIDKTAGAWYLNLNQPYAVNISNSSVLDNIQVTECATEVIIDDCAVGLSNTVDLPPIILTSNFAGNTITNGHYAKYEGETGDVGATITACSNVTITGARFDQFGDNTAATITRGAGSLGVLQLNQVNGFALNGVIAVGAAIRIVTSSDGSIINTVYADTPSNLATGTTNPVYSIDISTFSSDIVCSGMTNLGGIANVHPYNGFVGIANSFRVTVENLGTFASPYNAGSANQMGLVVALLGNGGDHIVRRCYTTNLRTGLVSTINSDSKIQLIDVRGDYADAVQLAALNVTAAKGLAATPGVTGQTSVYGTHILDAFTAATTGRILFSANEPTAISAAQLAITSGNPQFTSTGNVKLITVGDQVVWTMDYFALGHTALANIAPTFTGTNAGNHLMEFQWDTGSGWNGTWLTATGANLSAVGAINPATGIKLKVRATCTIAAAANALTFYRIDTVSTSVAQGNQYPLPGYALTLTGLVAGSEVRAYQGTDPSTAVLLGGVETSGTSFVLDYEAAVGGTAGYIVVFALGYQAITIPNTYPSEDSSIPIQQVIDRVYVNA